MIKNYFKIAWRNLWKHKTDSLINLTGLCIAFTSAILLLLSVSYEFSYDRFHTQHKDIYHLYFDVQKVKGSELSNAMPAPLLPELRKTYPDIRYGVRDINMGTVIRYKDKEISQNLKLTDVDFFRMFSFPIIKGNHQDPLGSTGDVVLRKGTAAAVFGEEDPLGKTIELKTSQGWTPYTVSAVADEFPGNSSITYDVVARFETLPYYTDLLSSWNNHFHDIYIRLNENVSREALTAKLPVFVNTHFKEDIERARRDGVQAGADGSIIRLLLQPLSDMHTNTAIGSGQANSLNKSYLYLLAVVGIFIVAIACINFINLSIGRSFTRTKEIGLRKTMGALKPQVAALFWSEAFLVCSVAFVMSSVAAAFLLPHYKQLFRFSFTADILKEPAVWGYMLGGFLLVTLVAGGYPAWQMARLNVVEILKGKAGLRRSNGLRNGLIAFQFTVAVLLISCTMITWKQLDFLRNKPLGYNTSQVISVPLQSSIDPAQALLRMKNELASQPAVLSVSGTYDNLGRGTDGSGRTSVMGFDYKNREIRSNWIGVSFDYVKTLDLEMIQGRDFNSQMPTDSSAVLINEEMAALLDEKEVIGAQLPVEGGPFTVIGVVKNYNFKSLHRKIDPLTLVIDKNFNVNYALVKVKPENLAGSMAAVKKAWGKIAPGEEFRGSFLDENVNRQYGREEKMAKIFVTGAGIAILLSCMGLLAMSILIVAQRTKEIGVRKVLGAGVGTIVTLLGKEFVVLVLVAILIASPIAWWAMSRWMQSFAYRTDIGWEIFALSGLLSLLIAVLTISWQAVKAALSNPVKALRTE